MLRLTTTTAEGKRVAFLGIDKNNVRRLMDGDPIRVSAASIGGPADDIIIFFGVTEQAMLDQLANYGIKVSVEDAVRVPKGATPPWESTSDQPPPPGPDAPSSP